MTFKLTYATMFSPPEQMHSSYESALQTVRGELGRSHHLFIDGNNIPGAATIEKYNPARSTELLGRFGRADVAQMNAAVAAARSARSSWAATPSAQRIALSRKLAALIETRVYHIAAALTLEVGKNRMEALGEAQEAADFFSVYAEDFERNGGYDRALLSLSEAVDRHVRDAQSIALEGFTHLIPCRAQDHPSATPSADELRVLRNMHARQ